ncbi:MAG: biopolymer transporter ExbD [Pirellulaceae bacterium]|nr:biopolymer transporter ExbD [Planctomycetota bacterium]
MRLTKRKRPTRPNIDITPMIDVVFLLLIFFITVSQISKAQNDPVQLPKLSGTADQQPTTLTINIREGGELVVDGTVFTESALVGVIIRSLAAVDDDPRRVRVVIRADQRALSGAVNRVVTALGRMDITRIRMAVQVPR